MPRIPEYQRQTKGSPVLPNVRVQAPGPEAFGGASAQALGGLGQAFAGMGDAVQEHLMREQEKRRKMNVLNASTNFENDVTDLLYGQEGLLHLQGENALPKVATKETPATPGVGQRAIQSLAGLQQKYRENLDPAEKAVFDQLIIPRAKSYARTAMQYEYEQSNTAFKASTEAAMSSYANTFAAAVGAGNFEAANNALRTAGGINDSTGGTLGLPSVAVTQAKANWFNHTISQAAIAQAKAGNIDLSKKIIDYYGDKLEANTKASLEGTLKPILEQNELYQYVESDIKKDSSLLNPDGSINTERAIAKAAERFGPDAVKEVTVPGTPGTPGALEGSALYTVSRLVSEKTGLPIELIFGQMHAEGADVNTELSGKHHNYAGIKATNPRPGIDPPAPDGGYYRHFDTDAEYAEYAAQNLQAYRGDGIFEAKSPEEFARRLYNGGYYTGSTGDAETDIANYAAGIQGGINILSEAPGGTPGTPATTQTVSAYDPVRWEKVQNMIRAAANDSARDAAQRMNLESERVKNALANASSYQEQLSIISDSSLPEHIKKDLSDKIASGVRSNMNKSANGALKILKASGGLTISDVDAMRSQLDPMDYLSWMAEATKQQKTDAEKANEDADKQWHTWVKGELFPGDAAKQNEYVADLESFLDNDGANGADRTVKARQYIDSQKKNVGYILGYRARNAEGFKELDTIYPVEPGQTPISTRILNTDPNADVAGWERILAQIGYMRESGDEAADEAWKFMIEHENVKFTEQAFWDTRNDIARLDGGI